MLRSEVRKASISINEVYPSIQGEGLLVGLPSLFIRVQGCNLRCPWCDQPSALPFKNPSTSLEDLISLVETYPHKHIVITGGEPFTEVSLPDLVKELLKMGKSVQIETNGTLWQEELEDVAENIHITCSPKAVAGWYVHQKIRKYAKELKFVVDENLNLDVLLAFEDFLKRSCVVLQPESNKAQFLEKALDLQNKLLHLGYEVRVLPQVHKLLGLK
ncbi:MAG: 7-carboxy-7-deazaguanine synthase QueE [Aquificota bacterium]|jgi:organic radical activating enzyme|nr:7-carboxy-7-deazaguanine synthase QueE [Aquificaceae bacterium]QWK13810.1 MAG: 7-carboxy-7-deazaguanine synthase QueE [Aquificota bacterium]HAV39656.1 7-carboxy-7-deazaguanine synthase [Aquificaceae bacterium]HCO39836.1 7-carboxy-7-deazaguanine synthase [Aquificaceae bacterium]